MIIKIIILVEFIMFYLLYLYDYCIKNAEIEDFFKILWSLFGGCFIGFFWILSETFYEYYFLNLYLIIFIKGAFVIFMLFVLYQ